MDFLTNEDIKNLDIHYLLGLIKPYSPYGNLYKSRMKAYLNADELLKEFERQESFFRAFDDSQSKDLSYLEHRISEVKDLRNSFKRAKDGFTLSSVELFEIKNYANQLNNIEEMSKTMNLPNYELTNVKGIKEIDLLLDPEQTGVMTFYIYDCYSEALTTYRKKKNELDRERRRIIADKKRKIEDELKIPLNPDGGTLIGKNDERLELAKKSELLVYSGETFSSVSFKLNKAGELADIESKIDIYKTREDLEEEKIRADLSKVIGKMQKELFGNAVRIGFLDLYIAKYHYARYIEGVKPEITSEHVIEFEEAIYPKLEESLRREGLKFTPISMSVKEGTTVITGANMGGKSVSLKLVGLIQALAQYGLFVPCKWAKVGLSEFIRTSIGDAQSVDTGLSTFGSEIYRISEAIAISDLKGTLLIDELARGTNPEEGRAITATVAEYLKNKPTITVMTTHYDEVATKASEHYQVSGLSKVNFGALSEIETIDEKLELISRHMDYRLEKAVGEKRIPRDALNIALIMGLQKEIVEAAFATMGRRYKTENKERMKL